MAEIMKDAYVTVEVANMARAVKFYTKVLGLKLVKNYKGYWADIKAPGLWIGLHLDHEGGPKKKGSGNMSIGFTPKDIVKAVQSLKKKGVRIKLEETEWGHYAEFKDPDGTDLYLWTYD
jgi:catechol 2,3-dioxygenase-like lactoylglutathione lyase family enzyme